MRRLRRVARVGLALYAAAIGVAAYREDGSPTDRARFAAVLATMHASWGAGFLVGVTRGARDAVDTSRAAQSSQPSA